jgi:hypothetical protein
MTLTPKHEVFVAGDSWLGDGSPKLRHTFNYLRATGGSLYYLQNDRILEGTEQVSIIVRDAVTGAEVSRTPQARNLDYTIRYPEGRIIFKSPVLSTQDPSSMITSNRLASRDTRGGDPVFIEVSYQYEADDNAGSTSWGAQARETVLDGKLSVGAGLCARRTRRRDGGRRLPVDGRGRGLPPHLAVIRRGRVRP